jgi:ribose/xylose/arabinose/galactoside ABC-type transport system permease subunit
MEQHIGGGSSVSERLAQLLLGPSDSPWDLRNRSALAVLFVLLLIALSFTYEGFLSAGNVQGLLLAMTATGVAAIGTTLLVISKNIDLSIGGQYAIISVAAAMVARDTQSAVLAVFAAIGLGAVLGTANGILVRVFKINPLIVTLAGASVLRGLAYVVSDAPTFVAIGRMRIIHIPIPVWSASLSLRLLPSS